MSVQIAPLSVAPAVDQYADERRSQVSQRMVAWWKEMGRPLAAFFGDKPLRKMLAADLTAYQNARRDLGRAPKTVNSELSVIATAAEIRQAVVSVRRGL